MKLQGTSTPEASASGYNLVNNTSLDLANAIVINPTANSYANTNRLESYFGQVNYDYEALIMCQVP
jgi:hypothetical protein